MLQQVAAVITRNEGQGQDVPRRVEPEDVALERFQKFRPPKFNGKTRDEGAERWLENIVGIFKALGYGEERKVNFAVFQLEEDAKDWWNLVDTKWEAEQTPKTWENFEREFQAKFIPGKMFLAE